jgi:hypothetical protein
LRQNVSNIYRQLSVAEERIRANEIRQQQRALQAQQRREEREADTYSTKKTEVRKKREQFLQE